MTEEEKKEFEEFLQWKKEKAEKEMTEKHSVSSNDNDASTLNRKEDGVTDSATPATDPQENGFKMLPILLAVVALVALFVILGTCARPKQPTQENEEYLVDSIEEVIDTVVADVEPSKKTWDFNIQKDPMTDTNNIWAQIQSEDFITQDFPYEGYTYASITCRYMKKYGYDVIVQISKGQINGRSYSGTNYVTARFDGGAAKKYYFDEAADGSSDHVFLRNSSDFMNRCKKAKEIIIDIPIYKSGRPAFSFHVDEPLVWRTE